MLLNLPGVRVCGDAPRPGEVRHPRNVFTRFGHVRVESRAYYHNKEKKTCRVPFDDALCLINGCTPAMARPALECAAKEPFDKAVDTFRKAFCSELTPDILKKLTRETGKLAAGFSKNAPPVPVAKDAKRPACVVVMGDGTGMPMRRKHLRGAKGRGPDGRAKTREVKIGAMFEMIPAPGNPKARARVPDSTTYVATLERAGSFGRRMRGEFRRRFPLVPEVTLFISDGAPWLRELCRTHFPQAVEILDFYHACEHLGPLLDLAGLSGKERKNTFRKWKRWFKEGKVDTLIGVCEALAQGACAAKAESWRKALGYYKANRDRMKYDVYVAKGWYIGSGVVESACRTLVAGRFKQPGMRWSRKGANAVLLLRTAYSSGRHDELWEYILHKRKQLGAA